MSRSDLDRWHKCERKKAWPAAQEQAAWGEARRLMVQALLAGQVHRLEVYRCKYSNPVAPHLHVGTRAAPFAVGSRGTLDAEGWAEALGITRQYHRAIGKLGVDSADEQQYNTPIGTSNTSSEEAPQMTTTTTALTIDHEFEMEVWQNENIQKLVGRSLATGNKYEAQHINPVLRQWAEWAAIRYNGKWDLMVKFMTLVRTGSSLSPAMSAVVLNSLVRSFKRHLETTKEQVAEAQHEYRNNLADARRQADSDAAREAGDVQVNLAQVEGNLRSVATVVKVPQQGRYTVDFGGTWRTIWFKKDSGSDKVWVSYLSGSDNESSYTKCGVIEADGELRLWSRWFRKGEQVKVEETTRNLVRAAILHLCGLEITEQLKAGERWSQEQLQVYGESRCFRCGRTLTVPSSVSAQMGPDCAAKWGA